MTSDRFYLFENPAAHGTISTGPMANRVRRDSASVGVSDHCGWAVLITVAQDGRFLDRRRIELVEPGLPSLPHHHPAQKLPIDEGVALVERVTRSAEACAEAGLESLAATVPVPITAIALRACPPLPATIAERITLYQAQTKADSVMFREALARAAEARGWAVRWYDARGVFPEAAKALGRNIDEHLAETGRALGPPWRLDHRQAMAAAIAAAANHLSRDR